MSGLSVGIIGAGIGGLTAATALAMQGMRVHVYEQASHFIPRAGAGFGFSPSGQVCLKSLGIETRHLLHRFDHLVHLDKAGRVNAESDLFAQIMQRHGFTTGGCLRADLVATLQDALIKTTRDIDSLLYSHKLVAMEQDDYRVRLEFDGHEHVEHDLVIGADGIHSKVPELIGIDLSPPVYSGANIYYGVIHDPDSISFVEKTIGVDHDVVQGNGTGEFITFRAGGASDKKVQVWANTYPSNAPPPREEWGVVDLSSPDLNTMVNSFPSSHPFRELFTYTAPERLLHFGLFFRKQKDVWSKGRTVLLDDSCHATLPYVGQGANQAIEDAVVLADCLSSSPEDHHNAFKSYFEQRSQRTKRIVKMAGYMDKLHHAQIPC